jgi:hypothetical protein
VDTRRGLEALASKPLRRDSVALLTASRAGIGAGGGLGEPRSLSEMSMIGILEGLREPLCFFQECNARLRRFQTHLYLRVKRLKVLLRPSGGGALAYW